MSVNRVNVSSVRFEINARQASASMQALEEEARDLNRKVTEAQRGIENLGNVPKDNPQRKAFEADIAKWKKDIRDINQTIKDYTRGVKAADELLRNYETGTIESMSMKAIKAGQNGLKKRIENIDPNKADAKELESYRAITEVIRESQRVVDDFRTDAEKTIQTIRDGGDVSVKTLRQTRDGLRDLKEGVAEGTKEWQTYQKQLTTVSEKLEAIGTEETRTSGQKLLGRAFRGDFATADVKTLNDVIAKLKEYQSVIDDPSGKGERHFAATERAIQSLTTQLGNAKGQIVTVEQAFRTADAVTGNLVKSVESVGSHVARATAETRSNLDTVNSKIASVNGEMASLGQHMDEMSNKSTNLMPYVDSLQQSNKLLKEQKAERQEVVDMYKAESDERAKAITTQKEQIALIEKERQEAINSLNARIEAAQKMLAQFKELPAEARGAAPVNEMIQTQLRSIKEMQKERFAIASEAEERLKQMNEQLAASIKADEEATAEANIIIENFDKKIAETKAKMDELAHSLPGFDADDLNKYTAELTSLNEQLSKQKEERAQLIATFDTERAERQKAIEAQKEQIALIEKESAEAIKSLEQRIQAEQENLATLQSLDPQTETFKQMSASIEEEIKKLQEEKDYLENSAEAKKRLADANDKLQAMIEADAKATADSEETIKRYDEQIKKLEQDIASYTQKLSQAKSPVDAKEYEEAAKKMAELQEELDAMTARREKYIETLQRETEEATRLAEAERSAAEAEQGSVSVENMEQSLKVLQEARRKTTDTGELDKINAAIEVLNQKVKESTGEWMSLKQAEEIASKAGGDGFIATAQQMTQATQAIERQRDALIKTIQQKQRDGKATADEEKKLQRLEKVLKDLKFEQDNFNMSHKQMDALLKQPKSAEDLNQLKAAIKRADGELMRMKQSLGENNKQYKEFAAQVKNAKNELKMMEGQAKATSSAFEKAWSRLKTYVGLYVGAAVAMQKLTATMGDLMELSDKMGEVRKTTGFTADEVGRLTTSLKGLDTRTPIVGLMELSSIAGSIGLKTQQDVEGFTIAANKLMVALPEMGSEAARTLMKIADATGDLEKNGRDVEQTLEKVGSTIIALRANSAAAAGPITDFVSRVGAVGAQAGISIDQIAALGATVDALGGRVEMSATALSRMIPAIKNNTFAVASAIGMTEKQLKGMTGMEQMVAIFRKLHDSVQQFDTSTDEGMNAMADKVEQMLGNSASMQEVMKTLNQQGARAGIVFGLLSQNVDKLEEQLRIAGDAYKDNTALMKEYNNMNETTAAKWERLKNQLEEAFVSDRMQRWLGDIIDFLRVLVDLLTEDGPIGSFFRWSLVYLAMWRAKWTEAIGTALISMGKFLFSTQASTAATAADTAAKAANTAATVAQAAATEAATVKTNMFAAAWSKLNKVQRANVIAAVATALVALGWHLYEVSRKAREAAKQMDVLADVEKEVREETTKERVELKKLYDATQDQTNSMNERKEALRKMVGDAKYKEYYSKLSTESELASAAASAYKELSEQILATARARALDAKAEELQGKRLNLELEKADREKWEDKNRANYRQQRAAYQQQQNYVGNVTGGATAGFQESQIAQQGAAAMKPAIIDEFEGSIRERNRIQGEIDQIDKDIEKLKDQVQKINPQGTGDGDNGGGGGGGGNNLYGTYDKVTSPYSEWNGNDLVARRKEMLERVKALANGADVKSVLDQDAKFISDAVKKNITTTEQAIEWYNTERLKIQDALYNKHLTPTGDWLDPKKGAGNWRKMIQNDFDTYLRILDAYYTERKAKIEKAQAEEGLSEAEAQRLTIENETVWRKHRMELQQIYQGKSEQIAKEERQRIYAILAEQDEDSVEMVEKTIMKSIDKMKILEGKNEVEYRKVMSKIVKDIATDFYKQQNAVSKQMEAITAIIAKERPFNGLTENLQKNLSTMGILFADLDKIRKDAIAKGLEPEDDMAQRAEQTNKRMLLLLSEAENAYSLTWEQLKEKMKAEGLGDWASALEMDEQQKQAVIASLHTFYDSVQDAIKKESSQIKKQTEIMWNDLIIPGSDGQNQSMKGVFERAISQLGLEQGRVSRANSLIGAGQASERVADRLAIKQLKVQIAMQDAYYKLIKKKGADHIAKLEQEAELLEKQGKMEEASIKRLDVKHAKTALALSDAEEQTKIMALQNQLAEKAEESQNRLYQSLREWADLLYSSVQSIMETYQAGDAEYYNELAKLDLTGKGGPGAGTYIVIDNEGTEDAKAHYEYLDERQALERQHEIEQENARAEAWRKVMDDLNAKMNDQITDWLNAAAQNASTDANTAALGTLTTAENANTNAMTSLSEQMAQLAEAFRESTTAGDGGSSDGGTTGTGESSSESGVSPAAQQKINDQNAVTQNKLENDKKEEESEKNKDKKMTTSSQSTFAKMTLAANMYGVAYQAMSNDNLSTTQKFEMMALQAVGNYAIGALTTEMAAASAKAATDSPGVLGTLWKQLGWAAAPVFAIFTGLLGGLMGLATSKISKAKSTIAQATGSSSASAGRLATGMLTYAEGNVNEFTDPATLTPGRQYNVDAADGRTYRARYMGTNPRTHITNGPEFHLSGERGREMIIDAGTTRQITMNEAEIWHAIQTLSTGGTLRHPSSLRRRGIAAHADGNLDEFDGMMGSEGMDGMGTDLSAIQSSLDRNSAIQEALLERLNEPIVAQNILYGPDGLPNILRKLSKQADRHGEKYL